MRKFFVLMFLLAFLAVGQAAFAQSGKIGVIAVDEILSRSESGSRAQSELKSKFEAREKEIAKQDEALKKMQEDIKGKSVALKAEAQNSKQSEFEAKVAQFREAYGKLAQDEQNEQQRLVTPMLNALKQVVNDYGKKNGFQVILERSNVLYSSDAIDLTNDIVKEFDSAWNKGGSSAGSSSKK